MYESSVCEGRLLTNLMKELGQLHFDLLSLEHVILCLLADGRDLVKLPGHRVRFLQTPGGILSSVWIGLSNRILIQMMVMNKQ